MMQYKIFLKALLLITCATLSLNGSATRTESSILHSERDLTLDAVDGAFRSWEKKTSVPICGAVVKFSFENFPEKNDSSSLGRFNFLSGQSDELFSLMLKLDNKSGMLNTEVHYADPNKGVDVVPVQLTESFNREEEIVFTLMHKNNTLGFFLSQHAEKSSKKFKKPIRPLFLNMASVINELELLVFGAEVKYSEIKLDNDC